MTNKDNTVKAAKGVRDRVSRRDGAQGPKERQMGVSEAKHKKSVREGRYCPGAGPEDQR